MIMASILISSMMVYRYGFNHSEENINTILVVTRFFYLIFILSFLIRYSLALDKRQHLTNNALEAILILLVIYDGISYFLFGHPVLENLLIRLNVSNYRDFYDFSIQFVLLIFVSIEFVKSINLIYTSRLKPTTLFILSFILLILVGSFLLMMPGFNNTGKALNYVDALFTSASASCVTGLAVENTANFLTPTIS